MLFVGADFYSLIDKVADEIKSVRRIIALDGGHGSWPDYETWLAAQSPRDPALPIAQEHCAIQMYTSGTTGHPKGAQLSHANLLPLAQGGLRHLGSWHEKDVNLVCMPLFHIGGSGWALIGFYGGIDTVLMRDADPGAILRLIPEHHITKAFMVPALLLFLLQHPQCRNTDFSSLEILVYGASPAPVDLVRNALKVFGCALAQVYGLTETTGAITYLPPEDHDEKAPDRLKSCGKADAWHRDPCRSTPMAKKSLRAKSARSSPARRRICSDTGISLRRRAERYAMTGSIPAMPDTSTKMATFTFTIG